MESTALTATNGAKVAVAGTVPIKRKSRNALLKAHKVHLKAQEVDDDAARLVKQPIMEEAYHASARSIRDLSIIPLSELKIETHHRGDGIIARTITPPYTGGAGTVTLIEDENGNVDKLAMYNQADGSILSNIPEGCVVAVKEPYYKQTAEHDFIISVDHPSDVLLLRFKDPIIPARLKVGTEAAMTKTAAEWRSVGDAAFIQRDFPTAVFCYTEALEEASAEDATFRASTYAKRSGTNLMMGRYDYAKADALASLTGTPADWRAYFNAAKAAYGLYKYRESRQLFESALAKNPTAPGLRKEYERCLARLHEETECDYDFPAMMASMSPQHVHLDHANFFGKTEVRQSPYHGQGLFAAQDIKTGELVVVEKATVMPNQYIPARASASLYANMVRQLHDNPSLAETVLDLFGGDEHPRTGAEGTMVDGVPVVDIFAVEGIRLKNCFSCPVSTLEETKPDSRTGDVQAKGLWRYASYLNHSCVPNTQRSFVGDIFILRACRDIAAGDELFQQYVPVRAGYDSRQERYAPWGFRCVCPLCAAEERSPRERRDRRLDLLYEMEKYGHKRAARNSIVPDAAIRTMERMAKQLEAMHEPEIYDDMPRLMLIFSQMWLIRAYRGRKHHAKVVATAEQVLRNFGYFPPRRPDGSVDVVEAIRRSGPTSLMTIHVVSVLRFAAESYRALGKAELAAECEEAASFAYMITTGFENDVSAIDEPLPT